MTKNRSKIFWKSLAVDYATFLVQPAAYMVGITSLKFKKIIGATKVSPSLFESIGEKRGKQRFNWCLIEKDYVKHAKIILSKLAKQPAFFKKINRESRNTIERLHSYALWLFKQDLSKYSNKKLSDNFLKLFNLWIDAGIWGHLVNLVDFDHHMLTNKITKFLEKKVKKHNYKLSMPETFGILTTPTKKNPLLEQEEDFYKQLELIQNNKKSINEAAKEHKEKYDWLEFHYSGPTILNKKYFAELFASEIKQRIKGEKKLEEFKEKTKKLSANQRKISKELELSKKELYWIDVAKTFMLLKALRKDIVFRASRLTDSLIKEVSKRLGLTPKQTRNITVDELIKGLEGKKLDKNLINKRISYCIWLIDNEKIYSFIGKRAKKYAKRITEEKVDKEINEFKGTPACVGYAKGAVKIISSADDMSKMNKGDILISPATNPNLMPAIKKAGAIITDEGGITCHAAIVSRELRIPCIIGTKVATKTLRDGQMVEVDADEGVVKVLNK